MRLYEVLETRRDEIMRRWQERVRGTLVPASLPPLELFDHLPEVLDSIAASLRENVGQRPTTRHDDDLNRSAATHGRQRLRLGFSLEAVVREYAALRDAIVDTADSGGMDVSRRELTVVFNALLDGLARAVSEYAHRRDAEFVRAANEHFAFIAHELRSPLSTATNAFQILKGQGALPTVNRAVDILDRGLRRTAQLIDETLQAARITSGVELRRQRTTLQSLLDDVKSGVVAEAEWKDVALRIVIERDEEVEVDVRLVYSALDNLARNAVKYTPAGGLVELRGRVLDSRLIVEVEDRCGGLQSDDLERAFNPFVRLDARQSGFGLGLSIAKQAAEAHGGTIRVQNVPSVGCIFVLDLPSVTGES